MSKRSEVSHAGEPSGAVAERLASVACRLGVTGEDLDELVHQLHSKTASQAYNDGEGPADDDEAYKQLHHAAEVAASEVNNGGLASQVRWLVEQLGEEETRDAVVAAADAARPAARRQTPAGVR